MRRPPYRPTDPAKATNQFAAEQLGYKSQRKIEAAQQQTSRYNDDSARRAIVLPSRTMSFYAEAITGTTNAVLRRSPKTTTFVPTTVRFPMGAAGRIIGASLWCTSARTGGSATLTVRIGNAGGTEATYSLPDVIIDGTTKDGHVRDQSAEWMTPVPNGIRFAAGDELRLQVFLTGWTSGSTPDFGAELIVVYDNLS